MHAILSRINRQLRFATANLAYGFLALAFAAGIPLKSFAVDWVFQTDTPRYVQENDLTLTQFPNFVNKFPAFMGCGAATAKMILESTAVNGTVRTLAQNRTDIEAHRAEGPDGNNNGGFYSDPVAVDWLLGQYDTRFGNATNHNRWIISSEANVKDAAAKLALTFDRYQTPSAGLVYGGGHWVAVTGVRTDVQPTTGAFSVKSFRINDPDSAGSKNQLISWDTWTKSYQTANKQGSTYHGKFVNVVDPDPVDPPYDTSGLFEPTRPLPGIAIASTVEAMSIAQSLLIQWDLTSDFGGLTPIYAEPVRISHTSDQGWWVGFGTDLGGDLLINGGMLIDSDQRDLLAAGWDLDQSIPFAGRTDYWPYLGNRVPTAGITGETVDTSGLFRVWVVPEPTSLLLIAFAALASFTSRRRN